MLSPMLVRPALTPGLKTPLYVVMRMLALVMFCISFGWAQQSENESVNRSSDASPVQPRTSQAAAPTAPPPTHEMQRLANMLAGRWSVGQAFEPRGGPKGVVGQGTEVWRPGPGARSLIEELQTRVGDREFSGLGVIWWDTQAQGYRVIWCGSANPRGCVVMSKLAHWEGDQFVVGDEFERDGRKVVYREVFSDFTPDSFTQTIYEGESGGELKRTLTIHAAKVPRAAPDDANQAQDEAAIRKIIADGDDAWNRHDAKAMVAHAAQSHDHINVAGKWGSGKDRFEKGMTEFFATRGSTVATIARSIEKIRFITPDVAILVVRNKYSNDKKTWEGMSTLVLHKMNGEWWNEAFQNTLVQPREEAIAQAERASVPMAQTEPEVIMPANSKIDFSADVAIIRKRAADAVDAWNRRDAKALAAHQSEDHDQIGVTGQWGSGRAQFEKALTAALAATRNNQRGSIAKIRFITPDVAIVIGWHEYTNDKETLKSISTSVLHKMNGEWWNEAFQNTYVRPPESSPSPHPREQRQ